MNKSNARGSAEMRPLSQGREGRARLDPRLWHGSFNQRESTLQQLAPYVGKLKSGMAGVLIKRFSEPGDVVLDAFSGSGVVPLESVFLGRQAWANDLNPYAYVLTRGKLEAPVSHGIALERAASVIEYVERAAVSTDLRRVPIWVREFFHPETLREIVAAFRILRERNDFFLLSCLLGILHHQRPGFLSYPASHLVPYLRNRKYPRERYPEMYSYRDLRSRLLAKVQRAYRQPRLPAGWDQREYSVWQNNTMSLPLRSSSVDAVISSPPYFKALDYARDNRLRLWFLGCHNWGALDSSLTAKANVYVPQMKSCLQEMCRVLKPGRYCVLVLGDVERNGKTKRTAEIVADLAVTATARGFAVEDVCDDLIPEDRRSRRHTQATKFERILVMRKT